LKFQTKRCHITQKASFFAVNAVITSDIASYASISSETFVTLHSLYHKVALFPPTVYCCSADASRIVSSDFAMGWENGSGYSISLFYNLNVAFSITCIFTFCRVLYCFFFYKVFLKPEQIIGFTCFVLLLI
jgi:hypothetical protein